MPTCLVIQHAEAEGPYAIGEALAAGGVELVTCRTFAGDIPPGSLDDLDALVVMGGPMSATSDDGFPTRTLEKGLLAEAVQRERPVLGVCLGAQLLAAANGGRVRPGPAGPEIGWAPVQLAPAAAEDALLAGLPAALDVLHWHGETYELPPGAVGLASSAAYPQQAFRLGPKAWGLQFHIEVDETAVDRFCTAFGEEAEAAGVPVADIRSRTPVALAQLTAQRDCVAERFAALVTSPALFPLR